MSISIVSTKIEKDLRGINRQGGCLFVFNLLKSCLFDKLSAILELLLHGASTRLVETVLIIKRMCSRIRIINTMNASSHHLPYWLKLWQIIIVAIKLLDFINVLPIGVRIAAAAVL